MLTQASSGITTAAARAMNPAHCGAAEAEYSNKDFSSELVSPGGSLQIKPNHGRTDRNPLGALCRRKAVEFLGVFFPVQNVYA